LLAIDGAEADNCSQFLFLIPELVSVWEAPMMKLRSLYADRAKYQCPARCYRPRLEILETRELPSTCTVDRLTDNNEGGNGMGDLRYCITNATDGDDIQFSVTGTINLTGALPGLTHSITMEGPGPDQLTVRRDTGGDYRIFTVNFGTTASIAGLTISNGSNPFGGGIFSAGSLTLTNVTVSGNKADTLLDYTNYSSGGGIANDGTLTLNNVTISGNTAESTQYSLGGGIINYGTVTLNNSTVSGNTAVQYNQDAALGGGIANGGTLTLDNSTVSGNIATSGGYSEGGGIYDNTIRTVAVNNSTIAGNSSNGYGGGVYEFSSTNARNTIIAGNTTYLSFGGPDLYGNLGSLGHNLIGNTQGGSGFDSTDLLNVNPLLGPLQDNGGPTETMALLPGSPAIDAGDNTDAPEWDQRGPGYPRIVNGIIDIGAFEYQGDGSGPSASGEARGRPILAAVVFDLPPRADFTPILSSATFPGQATIASVTRGVAPRWEEVSAPSAIVEDPRLASVHEGAPGPMPSLWPDPGPLQWSWPNPDLFPQEAGLAR
jgi:hypothetical protein